jgi:acetyltransferase-like isoleucine patch superfamily enzyme
MSFYQKFILLILAIPKTIYFNLKYFPFRDAIKFPVIVSHRVVLAKTKGKIVIDSPIKPGLIRIGFGGVRIFDRKYSRSVWHVNGKVTFKGRASLGYGTKLSVFGELIFGNNFAISAQTQIVCNKKICFGDDVLIGWDCLFMDSDAHFILNRDGVVINNPREIIIGDRVWFGARCTVTKGTIIANDVVVATNSCVYGKHETSNCIIGGNPTRILKTDITWKV